MENLPIEQDIRRLLETGLKLCGFSVISLSVEGEMRSHLLKLYVQRLGADSEGVSVEDCAFISERASLMLEAAGVFLGSYTIEVSSPGLHRVLGSKEDFLNHIGKQVDLRLEKRLTGRKRMHALIRRADENSLLLVTLENQDRIINMPFNFIRRANLIYDFEKKDYK